ncbi:MAG: ParB/Srx family N-terminal domain-containing protein [Pseudomonadota bacterium]|uniref:ParB/RepB/Spo0J family partition protein n=1 Tax=Marinobacter sp. G11 TaxID=2903522 RepID=UPI001E37EEF6|nr:ParB/Srx family N-terminal domain-containing protein [Marinobacter sp. G11]MCE0759478.1 chromosome partitioning protein ParB [Marinobacter sp. G11]MDY6928109.1 ParB/Srx family N-terminal domain-containing protein [Pseudomonadota bacterium]
MAQVNSLKSLNRASTDVSKSDLFSVAPHLILEEDGFNTRGAFCEDYYERPDIKAGIRSLADAYKRGDYVPPIIVKVRDGKVFVREGHRRRRAILLAISEGADIRKVQVLEHKGDEAEQTLLIATSNDGLPLTPLERAVIYGRLARWGWSDQEIAERVARTAEHVRQARSLLELPLELKKMIQAGEVAATYAAELFREHGEDAVSVLKQAQQETGDTPKKVTRKKVEKKNAPKIGKKVVEAMHKSVSSLTKRLDTLKEEGDTFTLTLTRDDVEELQELREKLAELEAEPRVDEKQQELTL